MRFGVDEAGKGPVLGPMVIAAVGVKDTTVLPEGVADSKRLTASTREELAENLRDNHQVEIAVEFISTDTIDDPDTDMNSLTVSGHAAAIAGLSDEYTSGIVDAAGPSEEQFAKRVTEEVPREVGIGGEYGADETHAIVSAASIIAKVERDRAIEALDEEYEADVGSGYPSDGTTRDFLQAYAETHGELPDCARTSWKTSTDILAEATQTSLNDL